MITELVDAGSKLARHELLLMETFDRVLPAGRAIYAAMTEASGHGVVDTLQGRVDSDVTQHVCPSSLLVAVTGRTARSIALR